MSQITRCPSCATTFKVVADQLRISEGWVRCGQCKEVFDASAHLLPSAPASLLPDVSLTDIKPPPAPAARAPEAARAWGAAHAGTGPESPPSTAAHRAPQIPASATVVAPAVPVQTPPAPITVSWDALAQEQVPVMEVPVPAVPAFLTSTAGESLSLQPASPFGWRRPQDSQLQELASSAAAEKTVLAELAEQVPPTVFEETVPASLDSLPLLPAAARTDRPYVVVTEAVPIPGGYELPFAELRDSQWPSEVGEPAVDEASESAAPRGSSFPALEATDATVTMEDPASPGLVDEDATAPADDKRSATPHAADDGMPALPPVDYVQIPKEAEPHGLDGLGLVEDDSVAAVLRAPPRKSLESHGDEQDEGDLEQEVSFVVAARRKAFWRKPVVRVILGLLLLATMAMLALQVAVHERDRIVAMDARARPWLLKLCEPLRCEIAPQRQIADVVIDSSSFNKARGDSYQLALTLKSQAVIPLAMPAIELTLTDAQDQPVLRRVLLPNDMGAPAELPARGEWSASVSVIVTTGGARVAGYRVLAFYP